MLTTMFLLVVFQADPQIVIAVDDGLQSRWLLHDLTCDYNTAVVITEHNRYLAHVQEELLAKLTIIHRDEYQAMRQHDMYSARKYPAIKIGGRFKEALYMPEDIVLERSYCMLTVVAYLNHYKDSDSYTRWIKKRRQLTNAADDKYARDVYEFITWRDPDMLFDNQYYKSLDIELCENKYGRDPKFPKYKEPVIPEAPKPVFPWYEMYDVPPIIPDIPKKDAADPVDAFLDLIVP